MKLMPFFIALLLLAGGSGWTLAFFIKGVDPAPLDLVGWGAFYASTVVFAGTVFSLLSALVRVLVGQKLTQLIAKRILRQGFLLGLLLAFLLFLKHNEYLTFFSAGLSVTAIIVAEALLSRR